MLKKFVLINEWDHKVFAEYILELQGVLEALASGGIPSSDYTLEDLKEFCISLLDNQQGILRPKERGYYSIVAGSWAITTDVQSMDSDCRFDYVLIPTTIVISILTFVMIKYPALLAGIPDFKEKLKVGYVFSHGRKFKGVGYDARDGLWQTLKILHKGLVFEYINDNPDFCPSFSEALRETCEEMQIDLKILDPEPEIDYDEYLQWRKQLKDKGY